MWWWEAERVVDGLINHLFENEMREHVALADMSESIPNLHIRLGDRSKRIVHREGIHLNNRYYLSIDMWSRVAVGDTVMVYEDIDNVSKAYIRIDDEFIALNARDEISLSVEEAKEIKRAYKKRINKEIKKVYRSGKK